jgi:hypothetical protein
MPIVIDPATEAQLDGKVGVVTKSTCGGAQIIWALVPGVVFNVIAKGTVELDETLVDAIVILPAPDAAAETSVTYQGMHSVSLAALRDAGFDYLGEGAAATEQSAGDAEVKQGALSFPSPKRLIKWGADAWNSAKSGIQKLLRKADCAVEGCVTLTVRLDVRNTDTSFGPAAKVVDGYDDGTTPMIQAWGANAGQQLQLPGVEVSALQTLLGIATRSTGTTNATSSASMQVVKGKSASICVAVENAAGSIHDLINRMEICDFRFGSSADRSRAFTRDSTVPMPIQNKYLNMLAQFTDGANYLKQVVGFVPRQVTVLTGKPANLLPLKGRASTPCLGFPNLAVESLSGVLQGVSATLAGPLGWVFAGAAEQIYEVDMWMPDGSEFAADRTLEDRTVPSHEYGHFAMCSLLYAEDPTKLVQIPSLYIQRIFEGGYADLGDEATRVMEAWADFFAGQTANGYNYIEFPGDDRRGSIKYCYGVGNDCWEGNYVEDTDGSPDPTNPTMALGVRNAIRRLGTILFDAFDGHRRFQDQPGRGDFWRAAAAPSTLLVRGGSLVNAEDDDPIALPGTSLRTLIRNWTHAASAIGWRVNEQQFLAALNATIRSAPRTPSSPATKSSWCDACALFAPHDGRSCATAGGTPQAGICTGSSGMVQTDMSASQMTALCELDPIRGYIGARPAPTDPTSACTFTGCPSRTILVGTPGEPTAACVACGARQVSVGSHDCSGCASPEVAGASCADCGGNELVGGPENNTCVSCPLHQVPNAAKVACTSCRWREVAVEGSCQPCPAGTWAAPDETCQPCPAGEVPYRDKCVPLSECSCDSKHCATLDASGLVCIDIVG